MKTLITCLSILIVLVACEESDNSRQQENKLSTKQSTQRCDLTPDPGTCKAAFTRYYYDKTAGTCKSFFWGGCDGVVPFETLEECKQCAQAQGD